MIDFAVPAVVKWREQDTAEDGSPANTVHSVHSIRADILQRQESARTAHEFVTDHSDDRPHIIIDTKNTT